MSSRFPISIAAALLAVGACHKQSDEVAKLAPQGEGMNNVPASALIPAGGSLPQGLDPKALPYYDSADAVITGKRLYNQFNCVGCHFNGGGGIGPPLMDDIWVYGGRLDQIYNSIYQGRANGMPAWGGKLTDEQIWQIAAYVRSMSLPETLAANGTGTPSQHPAPVPRGADMHGGWVLPKDTVGAAP